MFFFLITCCLSFILLYQSLALKPLPPWACDMRLLSLWFWKDLPFFPITKSIKNILFLLFSSRMSLRKKNVLSKAENFDMKSDMSVLDLPDLVLECILEKLPPEGLCKMACVCTYLRERCMSGHLWEKHMKNKWARIVGPAAYREWQWHIASRKGSVFFNQGKQKGGLMGYLTHLWPLALIRSSASNVSKKKNLPQVDSIMYWYIALESGKFWFPAQVYNREVLNVWISFSVQLILQLGWTS